MHIIIAKEPDEREHRVALCPEGVKKLVSLGLKVSVEPGAGDHAGFSDTAYAAQGATLIPIDQGPSSCVVLVVRPTPAWVHETTFQQNTTLLGLLGRDPSAYANIPITTLSLELLPRITRAQTMDVLSSQANLAGYRAVIESSFYFNRCFPMMMTAAGTVPPARVLVIGAGVAGLQAMATARRLGAIVTGYDVRPETKDQVESVGATFISSAQGQTGQGGYAQEMDADYKSKEAELMTKVLPTMDIVITTAQIPGKPAPRLITEAHLTTMKRGSVVIDLASGSGGNCEGSPLTGHTLVHGIHLVGGAYILNGISGEASRLYGRNMTTLIAEWWDAKSTSFKPIESDEILSKMRLSAFSPSH